MVSARSWQTPGAAHDDIGFRCVIDAAQEITDAELLYRADLWFPHPPVGGAELNMPGLDGADRAYLHRRIVTGAIIEGRELEGLSVALAVLQRQPRDPVAMDLVNRVRSKLVELASSGDASQLALAHQHLHSELRSDSETGQLFDGIDRLLAEMMVHQARGYLKKGEYITARRGLEYSRELDPSNLDAVRLLAEAAPAEGSTRISEIDQREMVWVPGGSFRRGASSADRSAENDEGPAIKVSLPGFWLSQTLKKR